jgi:hypothetical protein
VRGAGSILRIIEQVCASHAGLENADVARSTPLLKTFTIAGNAGSGNVNK